jgi:MFS family permease
VPLYPVYALLFADSGLSAAQISGLFVLWSVVGIVAEVPGGAWADRHSRRTAIAAAGVFQAAGHLLWIVHPTFAGFALGFAVWSIGGALSSGSVQALVHDGLSAAGEEHRYAAVIGRMEAASLVVQVPLALVAGVLFEVGGYPLLGVASVLVCLSAAALATRLPEAPRPAVADGEDEPGFLATMRSGVGEAVGSPAVRAAALAVAVFTGFDAIEEYFPLLASEWGVPTGAVPAALLAIPLAGAAGAVLAGRAGGLRARTLTLAMLAGAGALAAALVLGRPEGLAGVTLFYGIHRLVMVIADARLQARIEGGSRATVTSVASLASELVAIALFVAWALGGFGLVILIAVVAAVTLGPRLSPSSPPAASRGRGR